MGRMEQWRGVEGEQASQAIIRPVGLNGWPPSANTKGVVTAELESGPHLKNSGHQRWLVSAGFMSQDVHTAKTFGLNNDIFHYCIYLCYPKKKRLIRKVIFPAGFL